MSEQKPSRRMPLIGAMVGISLGSWLFMEANGVDVPSMVKFWPGFIALGALASLLDFILTKTPSSLGKAVFGSVMCVTAFLLTFHVLSWRDVFSWLPALPLGAGLGMVTTHAASQSSSHRLLIRGAVFAALGIAGWLPQFPQLREMLPSMQTVWAVLLIAIGGIILYQQLKD
ncbi:MAG: hypothetical protein KDC35_13300 [Acidobacteria bacterium]|nr:hypothetical protein [Acidobacteriota bacterium]